jgi:hypothetical protein
MVNSITNYGQLIMLYQDGTTTRAAFEAGLAGTITNVGGIIKMMTRLRLYTSASVFTKNQSGQSVVQASGGGYAAKTISSANWTVSVSSGNTQVVLADQVWTAAGGSIANIAGAYATDTDSNVIAWWERTTPITLNDMDSITADDLTIRPT